MEGREGGEFRGERVQRDEGWICSRKGFGLRGAGI